VGDSVKANELLAEVETDKATMEYESYNTGTLLYIGAEAGKSVAVNGVLAVIGDKDADWKTLLKAHEAKGSAPSEASSGAAATTGATAESAKPAVAAVATEQSSNGRIKASPLAKKLASDKGIDIGKIEGTGDQGRITKRDVENYKPAATGQVGRCCNPNVLPAVVGKKVLKRRLYHRCARQLQGDWLKAITLTSMSPWLNMDKAVEARKSIRGSGKNFLQRHGY
jgi:pyruvate dehydrogenase E2 component (dihydrolipoamide acetyltransferase)